MTHEHAAELIALHVLDALDPGERRELEAHVATCDACRAELRALRPVADALLVAVPEREPAPGLRGRVLDAALAARAPAGRRPPATLRAALPAWLAAAAAIVIAAGGLFYANRTSQQLSAARAEIAILTAPDVVRVDLQGQPVAPDSTGRVYWSRSRGLVFSASKLPALPASKIYQLWFVTTGGAISAGLVQPGPSGDSVLTFDNPPGIVGPVALAITIEPAGGVPSPTGDKYLVGAVPAAGA